MSNPKKIASLSEMIEWLSETLNLTIDHRQLVSDIVSQGTRSTLLRIQWIKQITTSQELRNS